MAEGGRGKIWRSTDLCFWFLEEACFSPDAKCRDNPLMSLGVPCSGPEVFDKAEELMSPREQSTSAMLPLVQT